MWVSINALPVDEFGENGLVDYAPLVSHALVEVVTYFQVGAWSQSLLHPRHVQYFVPTMHLLRQLLAQLKRIKNYIHKFCLYLHLTY